MRCGLFPMWGQSSNKPAVLFSACSVFLQSQSWSLALQHRAGKHRQLHFPSWCLREEQIFPSLQHNQGFQLFFCQSCNSLGLDSCWTGCCSYLRSAVHAPSNVHAFLCRQTDAADNRGEEKVVASTKPSDDGGGSQSCTSQALQLAAVV